MRASLELDDLRLVLVISRLGSIGAGARSLRFSQPTASARISRLERRLATRLFERDTTGARPTVAGAALAQEAEHVLLLLDDLPARALTAARAPIMRVATIPTLAGLVLPALDSVFREPKGSVVRIHQMVHHGDTLLSLVGEGAVDLAVVGVASQLKQPPGVVSTRLGMDELAAFVPSGANPPGTGLRPLSGPIPYHCVDLSCPEVELRISRAGGDPERMATGEVAMLVARRRGATALVAAGIARAYRVANEQVLKSPVTASFTYHLVTRTPVPEWIAGLREQLVDEMGILP